MAQQGRGGMGSHKHGVSGNAPRSPAYKQAQTREANRLADEARDKKAKPKVFRSVSDALKQPH